jgi:hypothetical protein
MKVIIVYYYHYCIIIIIIIIIIIFVRLYTWISASAMNMGVFCRASTGP